MVLGPSGKGLVHEPGRFPARRVVVLDHTMLSFQEHGDGDSERDAERNQVTRWLTLSEYPLGRELFDPAQAPSHLEDCFGLDVPVTLISDTEVERLTFDAYEGWRPFWKQYPDAQGILTLSRVTFDVEARRALVYVGIQSGADAGSGSYIVLHRGNDGWVVEDTLLMWVS
jgi:hypothetical protein